jgi:hypothetical protein
MKKTYLLWYKGTDRWVDRLIRLVDGGSYSHVEIAEESSDGSWTIISASKRDNHQVRMKQLTLNPEHWDIMEVNHNLPHHPLEMSLSFLGREYDTVGAVLSVTRLGRSRKDRIHCSALVGQVMGLQDPWRLSVRELYNEITEKFETKMKGS